MSSVSDDLQDGDTPVERGLGLSARLLLLTILAVMVAEVFIFVPSIANFREKWLADRLSAARIASLAAEASPDGQLPASLRDDILMSAQVRAVSLKRNARRLLIIQDEMPPVIDAFYDMRDPSMFARIRDALAVFFHPPTRVIRVIGQPGMSGDDLIDIVLLEGPLKKAMIDFSLNILALSIVISVFTAALVYLALNWLLVRPMMRIVRSMEQFAADPEDATRIMVASGRTDEIGFAERELAKMQMDLSQTLVQKNRLAALGLAVSKINHDLRNMLANAQLISDRFGAVDDPTVQRFAPKLIGALDRAVRLCTSTLKFGKAEEAAPERTMFLLRPLVEEVGEQLGLPSTGSGKTGDPDTAWAGPVAWKVGADQDLEIHADRDQMFRILSNLVRNAAEVVAGLDDGARDELEGRVEVDAETRNDGTRIHVRDTGPGIPIQAQEHLFEAFQGSARVGGTGLGLAIAAELVRAHGGALRLCEEDSAIINRDGESANGQTRGAHFEVFLPSNGNGDSGV